MASTPLTKQERLEQAEAAYADMIMGLTVRVFVDQNGERVEYKAGDADKLAAYIRRLKFELNPTSQAGPMGITIC